MSDIILLRFIWWILMGVLLIAFAITDGFDFGAATLFPFVARNEAEKTIVLNTLRPYWEGNQVWIILGAGAIFAAWPYVYAVAFSGAYFAILLLLLTMGIARPVSFKYRSKLSHSTWRAFWDDVVFVGGFIPSILFGILVGNVLVGLPFYLDNDLRISYSGSFLDLFNPFALGCGLVSLAMLCMHGGLYLAVKTENPIRQRAIFYAQIAGILFIFLFAGMGFWVKALSSYQVLHVDPAGFSNPLHKEVIPRIGGWLNNYKHYSFTLIAPGLGFGGAVIAIATAHLFDSRLAFFGSALSIIGVITTVGVSMFPFILPSSINLASSLLVWDASSSALTLSVMLVSVVIFLPIIILYTLWVYNALGGKVRVNSLKEPEQRY